LLLPIFGASLLKKIIIKKIRMRKYIIGKLKQYLDNYEIMYPPARVPFENDLPYLKAEFLHLMSDPQLQKKPMYIWGCLQGAALAKSLGYKRISFLEFGVAAGGGLKVIDKLAAILSEQLQIDIEVYGFDTGKGMPKPADYRDLPNLFSDGEYNMNFDQLAKSLKKSKLQIGLIEDTIPAFHKSNFAPIAFVSMDLDYYSSTCDALKIFSTDAAHMLPRVFCYFDDVFIRSYCEFNGPNLAIDEYNATNAKHKIGRIYGLRYFLPFKNWNWPESVYYHHSFDHPKYNDREFVGVYHS
jgi:hypothetical protein